MVYFTRIATDQIWLKLCMIWNERTDEYFWHFSSKLVPTTKPFNPLFLDFGKKIFLFPFVVRILYEGKGHVYYKENITTYSSSPFFTFSLSSSKMLSRFKFLKSFIVSFLGSLAISSNLARANCPFNSLIIDKNSN